MKADWRECPREKRTGQWSGIYVTMNARGYIVLGSSAYQRMGEPSAFLLWYDAANNRIGLKPTHVAMKNAFPAAKSGRHGGRLIRARRLLGEFGIIVKETIEFPEAEIDHEGILILDMRSARISTRAKAASK
jgi:hypothetical protein